MSILFDLICVAFNNNIDGLISMLIDIKNIEYINSVLYVLTDNIHVDLYHKEIDLLLIAGGNLHINMQNSSFINIIKNGSPSTVFKYIKYSNINEHTELKKYLIDYINNHDIYVDKHLYLNLINYCK
jgi:hypothetical protein